MIAKLNRISQFIVLTLRDHIFKENNILYPTALQVIPEKETWQMMKRKADKIGYCCFTPKKTKDLKIFKCPECGLAYKEKEWAKKCEVWCQEHKSCNLEIIKHSIKKF